MTAIKGTDFKKEFKDVCDRAYRGETFIISRPRNENVVVISEKKYEQMERLLKYAMLLSQNSKTDPDSGIHKRSIGRYSAGFVSVSEDFDDTLEGLEDHI